MTAKNLIEQVVNGVNPQDIVESSIDDLLKTQNSPLMHPGKGNKQWPKIRETDPEKVWDQLLQNRGSVFELSGLTSPAFRYTAMMYPRKNPAAGGEGDVVELALHERPRVYHLVPTKGLRDRDMNERHFKSMFRNELKSLHRK